MKVKIAGVLNIIGLFLLSCQTENSFLLDMDGNRYATNIYGDTEWMIANLQVTKSRKGSQIGYFFPDNLEGNQAEFGLLYDFETACEVCPEGWMLPSIQDWEELIVHIGDKAAIKMKDIDHWEGESNMNNSGFSARPAGYGNSGEFDNLFGQRSIFWTSDHEGEDYWTYLFELGKDTLRMAPQHPVYGFSVRCINRRR